MYRKQIYTIYLNTYLYYKTNKKVTAKSIPAKPQLLEVAFLSHHNIYHLLTIFLFGVICLQHTTPVCCLSHNKKADAFKPNLLSIFTYFINRTNCNERAHCSTSISSGDRKSSTSAWIYDMNHTILQNIKLPDIKITNYGQWLEIWMCKLKSGKLSEWQKRHRNGASRPSFSALSQQNRLCKHKINLINLVIRSLSKHSSPWKSTAPKHILDNLKMWSGKRRPCCFGHFVGHVAPALMYQYKFAHILSIRLC